MAYFRFTYGQLWNDIRQFCPILLVLFQFIFFQLKWDVQIVFSITETMLKVESEVNIAFCGALSRVFIGFVFWCVQNFGFASRNPVLKNITEYLVDEGSYEEEALLGTVSCQLHIFRLVTSPPIAKSKSTTLESKSGWNEKVQVHCPRVRVRLKRESPSPLPSSQSPSPNPKEHLNTGVWALSGFNSCFSERHTLFLLFVVKLQVDLTKDLQQKTSSPSPFSSSPSPAKMDWSPSPDSRTTSLHILLNSPHNCGNLWISTYLLLRLYDILFLQWLWSYMISYCPKCYYV